MVDATNVGRRITNKTCHRTAISRMATANVLRDVMYQITGHKNHSSLDLYDDTLKVATSVF
jgi:hypothetical protein